ncbi:perlucin-like [Ruditapes philippinarum]|uniref:perlucin-like n=1 Tax=Ruditapes philippinarum TaxID=129788 RepID=UPI00295A8AB2|nr:perlucin-like [Ruditapes philippinarum]
MQTHFIVWLFTCFAIISVYQACDPGWKSFQDSCYQFFTELKSWPDAKAHCESIESHLVIVMTSDENNFLKSYLRQIRHTQHIDQVWMDGDDFKSEGSWIWDNTGEKFEILDWGPGEPNQNGGEEDCVSFYSHDNFRWNDEHCNKNFNFLCEYELYTNESSILG